MRFILPRLLAATLLLLSLNTANAQKWTPGYIMTDSALLQGQVRHIGKGRIEYRRAANTPPLNYPDVYIKEYSTGRYTYEALTIDGQRAFYERLISGTANLYRTGNGYILKTGNSMESFNRKNFRSAVGSMLQCEGSDRSFSALTYSKASLKYVVRRSNEGKCNTDVIPYRKLGIYAGYNLSTYTLLNSRYQFSGHDQAPGVGLFFDLPMYRAPSIYFVGDISWFSAKPILYGTESSSTHYVALNINQLTTQANFKFITGRGSLRPYAKLGTFVSFVDATAPEGMINTTLANSVVTITNDEFRESGVSFFGLNLGAGLDIKVGGRKNMHVEIRHQRSTKANVQPYNMKYSNLSFSVGFNI